MESARRILKNPLPVLHSLFKRKILLHKPPAVLRDPLQVRGTQCPHHVCRNALRGVIFHNKSRLPVYYNIRYRPDRRREHRGPAGHGLEHDVREPFGVRGEDEEGERVQVAGGLMQASRNQGRLLEEVCYVLPTSKVTKLWQEVQNPGGHNGIVLMLGLRGAYG